LCHHDHHHRDPGGQSTDAVDQHPVRRFESRRCPPPVPYHPCLRQSERHECSHRKQRNQPVRHSFKQNQQQPRQNRQRPDPLREHQPPSPRRQRMRKIIIPSDHPAQPRKIRKRRIRRQTQHQQNREHCHIVKNPFSRHRRRHHRHRALIPPRPRIRSHNSVVPPEHPNPAEQHNQNRNDRRQRSPSRRNHRLPKRLHSITNRLHPSQSRAPRGERLKKNPRPPPPQRRRRASRRLSQRHHRHRMSSRRDHLI